MRMSAAIPVDVLARRLEELGFTLPESAASPLASYLGQLMQWNKAMNLIGARSWEEALDTLVVDSFHLAAFLPYLGLAKNPVAWDLGAGAGLPGIPLRMLWKSGTYTLVEAREKRALFMRTVLAGIALEQISVFHGRAEFFFRTSGSADLVVSRAFMPWRDMLFFIEDVVAPTGRVVFLALTPAPCDLPTPWRLVDQKPYAVAGKERHFWCFTKE